MTDAARVFLLSGAILYVLMSTVLYRAAGRPFVHWYMSFFQFPRLLRRLLAHDRLPDADDLILMAYMSDDFKEGVAAFLEKRPAQWKGR